MASSDNKHQEATGLHKDWKKSEYYVLSADFQGTTRLALQQYIWRQALGFNIHPAIPKLAPDAAVADVACGTALWLVEVSREVDRSSELHAFDVNLGQAPAKEWLPENLTLHKWNMFDEVPQAFVGKFDLVHVRLIQVAIKDNDPTPIMKNFCKLLKPGGYVQWDEVDTAESFVVKARPELEAPAMDAWCHWMRTPKAGPQTSPETYWHHGSNAEKLFKSNGFDQAQRFDLKEAFLQHPDLMRYNNDQLLMLSEQLARRMFADGHEKAAFSLKIVDEAGKDAEQGAIMIMPPVIWVARKA